VLIAISTEGKIGLGLVAGIFIVFALVASFWFPRRNPDFPGERLGLFIAVSVALFLATVGAVVVFTATEEEGHGAEAAETHAAGEPEGEDADAGEGDESGGNATAGESLFAANGCGGCHTLEAAGSSGNVGPNLDESDVSFDEAVEVISNGRGAMPAFGDQLADQELRDLAAFVTQ